MPEYFHDPKVARIVRLAIKERQLFLGVLQAESSDPLTASWDRAGMARNDLVAALRTYRPALSEIAKLPPQTTGVATDKEIVRRALLWEQSLQQTQKFDLGRVEMGRREIEQQALWENFVEALDTRPELAQRGL